MGKQYWKTKEIIIAYLISFLFLVGHICSNLGYENSGGKQVAGFFFFSPYMNWLPVDISSNLPVAWALATPLLSVLAGGLIAANQGKSGYQKYIRTRQNFRTYRRTTYLVAGFFGAVLPAVVLVLDFVCLLAIHPNTLPNQWLNNNVAISYLGIVGHEFYTHTWLYMLGWILFIGIYGASYAILSNFLYFVTGKLIVSLLGLMAVQLILLAISMIAGVSLAPMAYLRIVPTIGQPSLFYVLFWPFVLIAVSLFAFRKLAVEV